MQAVLVVALAEQLLRGNADRIGDHPFSAPAGVVQCAVERAASLQQSYDSGVTSSIAENQELTNAWENVESFEDTQSSKLGQTEQLAWKRAEEIGNEENWTTQEKRAFAVALSAGASGGMLGLKGGLELSSNSEESFSASESVKAALSEAFNRDGTLSDEYSDVRSAAERDSHAERGTASVVDSAREEHSEKLTAAEQAREQSQRLASASDTWGHNRTFEMAEARSMLANDEGTAQKYRDWQSERLESMGRHGEAERVQAMSGGMLADHFADTVAQGPQEGEDSMAFFQGLEHTLDQTGAAGNPFESPSGGPSVGRPQDGMSPVDMDDLRLQNGQSRSDVDAPRGPDAEAGDGRRGQEGMESRVGGNPGDRDTSFSDGERRSLYLPAMNHFAGWMGSVDPSGAPQMVETAREQGGEMEENNRAGETAEVVRHGSEEAGSGVAATTVSVGNAVTGGAYGKAVGWIQDGFDRLRGRGGGD